MTRSDDVNVLPDGLPVPVDDGACDHLTECAAPNRDLWMRHGALFATFLVSTLLSAGTRSDVPDSNRHEVLHLLEFLRSSGCAMERNGKRYGSEDAYSHVKRKYEHFQDEIKTPEDFIEYAASKSTMSGEYYLVFCEDEPEMRTRDWLLDELRRYRR